MPSESHKPVGLCLCFLILGVLIGISIDAEFRPNHIRFWVNDLNNLSFIPHQGDTIEWFRLSTATPMKITFWGPSPCVGAFNPCTIGNIPKSTIYTYSCMAQEDPTFTCNDPQGGPMSSTQSLNATGTGPEATGFFTKISDLIKNIFASLTHILSHSPQPATPSTTQNIAGDIATDQAKIGKTPSEEATTRTTLPGIQATVYCDANPNPNTTHVIAPQQSGTPDAPIQASANQKIQWTTPSTAGFIITMADKTTCNPNVSTLGPNGICTVAKPGSYTATVPSCSATPETIVPPQ
jgi:hypothetical protein